MHLEIWGTQRLAPGEDPNAMERMDG